LILGAKRCKAVGMVEALYNTRILRLAASVGHHTRLAAPQASVTKVSPICGSRISIDLSLDALDQVAEFGQEVRACALGQASAALLSSHIIGMTAQSLNHARAALKALLGGAQSEVYPKDVPASLLDDLQIFSPAVPHKARHGAILLPFEAACAAADQANIQAQNVGQA
jgi:NifU-like protein involved in Fe-S cluster formation